MAQFLADIAGLLAIFAIAGGLVLLHRASKEAPAKLLKAAGWVLVAGGVIVGLCTSYYWFKYQSRGDFDSAHMDFPNMTRSRGMGPEMMGPMGPGSMPGGIRPLAEQPGDAR
jgi:hypothetical protein